MNRRDFVLAIMSAPVVAAIPVGMWLPSVNKIPNFDPSNQYGNYIVLTDGLTDEAIDLIVLQAREALPKGTKFGMRYRHPSMFQGTNDPLYEISTLAWRYPYDPNIHHLVEIA